MANIKGYVQKRKYWGSNFLDKISQNNKGKSGEVRTLFLYSKEVIVLLITLYSKFEKENITQAEKNILKSMFRKVIKRN